MIFLSVMDGGNVVEKEMNTSDFDFDQLLEQNKQCISIGFVIFT